MNGWVHNSAERRSLLAVLMLLALLMRAVIPTGFMPTATATGVVIQLCSDSIGKTVLIDLNATDAQRKPLPNGQANDPADGPTDGQRSANDSPCLFAAGAAHLLLPTIYPAVLAPVFHAATTRAIAAPDSGWLPLLAAPPPPVRGPPLSA